MPDLSRSQVVLYGAVAVALLLVGARAIRAEPGDGSARAAATAPADSAEVRIDTGGEDLVVDVAGAVRRPGVYRLPAAARVIDAIERAGGAARDAGLAGINRAARLTDGQQVVVPETPPAGASAPSSTAAVEDGPISLGTATADQLEEIDGIGPVTAGKIVEFRDAHGGLASVDQLDQVSGIGPATMESLRDRLQP